MCLNFVKYFIYRFIIEMTAKYCKLLTQKKTCLDAYDCKAYFETSTQTHFI